MNNSDLINALIAIAGDDAVRTDPETLTLFGSDVHESGSSPCVVVRPDSAAKVAACVAACTSRGYTIGPRGGGLSYTAGYIPTSEKAVMLDLTGLDQIHDVSPEDMTITVGAGTTWKQIHDKLKPLGLRLPFFGTFSGKHATVGGGLSHGALFFGSARYGSAAEIVLGMQVACADGRLLNTGQAALQLESKPFLRTYGPDLTGVFVHDGGTLGVKTKATFRLIKAPAVEDYLSFAFERFEDASKALSAIARNDLAEEVFVLSPESTDNLNLSTQDMVRSAKAVAKASRGPLRALKNLTKMGLSGSQVVPIGHFSLHMTVSGRVRASILADAREARSIVHRFGGTEIGSTIPRVARADLFANVNDILDPDGSRWTALNAKVAHSDAPKLIAGFDELLAKHRQQLDDLGITVTRLGSAFTNHCYSFEPVFHWQDSWLPIHRAAAEPTHLQRFEEPKANPAARKFVNELRKETVELFRSLGAASNQIGRAYPYYSALSPDYASLLMTIKRHVDPDGLLNPGVLELPTPTRD